MKEDWGGVEVICFRGAEGRAGTRTSLPSLYVNWASDLDTSAVPTISPARKVRSTVFPVIWFFSLLLTKAAPLPGFTCWNSAGGAMTLEQLQAGPAPRKDFHILPSS